MHMGDLAAVIAAVDEHRLVEESNLSPASLKALLAGEVLAIRIPSFLAPAECDAVERGIVQHGIEYYVGDTKADTEERKGKIGPNVFRFKDDLPEYFRRVREYEEEGQPMLFREVDVPGRFSQALASAHGGPAMRARSSRGCLSSCTVRALPSAPPHRDWIRAELPDFDAFATLQDQFAWNVYISVGRRGGETLVFDTEDPANVVSLDQWSVKHAPQRGDLLLFCTRNVHAVLPTDGDRLTVSGFWGPVSEGSLQYWV
jgi:hypothetical protein